MQNNITNVKVLNHLLLSIRNCSWRYFEPSYYWLHYANCARGKMQMMMQTHKNSYIDSNLCTMQTHWWLQVGHRFGVGKRWKA